MSRYGSTQHTTFGDVEPCAVKIDQVDGAMADLRRAFNSDKTRPLEWRKQQIRQFLKMLREGAGEICAAMKKDLHKSPFESYVTEISLVEAECNEALAHLDEWAAPQSTTTSALNWPAGSATVRDPLGVVLVMGAWNYPTQLTLAPVVGALAGGNCVLIRPGSYAVETSHAICRLVDRYLDKECVKVAEGDRHLTTKILEHKFDTIFYTGSGFVGKIVAEAAAKHLTPCVLELGGKSPTIVDKSAHLEHAAQRVCWATFLNSGQTCVRPDFCLVHESVADKFIAIMRKTVREFYGPDAKTTEYFGRIINARAHERLSKLVEQGRDKIAFGGALDSSERYVEPTLFDFGTDLQAFQKHPLMQDEIFGPLFPLARYSSIKDVVDVIRALPTGKPLACYCYARDSKVIKEITERTTSGGLCINDSIMHLANHELPFGGVGESGMGAYHGRRSFNAFTHEKAVLRKYPLVDEMPILKQLLAARFPPYTPFKKTAVKIFGSRLMEKAVNPPLGAMKTFIIRLVIFVIVLRFLGVKVSVSY
eukprot:TRINITY_DN191_c0_g1_i1.p1 TRINITY_DN191_c0_g1~~TRINITY_DN191_c0_g1_i1.p1  ORF type:complete len:535 (+),score=213.34 TRINITY_DN191_c0_g1_i1:69-1673(+)